MTDEQNLYNKPGKKGLKRLLAATNYSMKGLKAAWKYEEGIRQELFALIIAIPLAFYLNDNGVERILLIGSIVLVLIIELMNSALEAVVDRIGSDFHTLSGRAKDIGSAAVLVGIINSAVIWFSLVIFPRLFS